MYILDTDIVIWILRNRSDVIKSIEEFRSKGSVGISTITVAEVYKNIFPFEITHAEVLFMSLDILDVNPSIAKEGGFYWQRFAKILKELSLADCLIAATAKVYHRKLLTLNTKHFQMSDIQVLNPLKSKV